MKKAVVLLSGGLDSTTCLAMAKAQGFECIALSFSYGQRHSVELQAACSIAKAMQVHTHKIITLDPLQFGGSALTDERIAVPDYTGHTEIPVTYVPARNTVFLAIALSVAEASEAEAIFIGVSAIDYSHYPDCRPEFIEQFQKLATLATKAGVQGNPISIQAPLQFLSKAETIHAGIALGVEYSLTISCYQANEKGAACGKCDSCTLRRKGFNEAKIADPTHYQ